MYYLSKFKNREDFYKFVSKRIKQMRLLMGYTQDYISESVNMTVGNYSKLERSTSKCSLYTLFKFLDTLNIKLEDFFELNEQEYTSLIQKHATNVSQSFVTELEKSFEAVLQTYKINSKK